MLLLHAGTSVALRTRLILRANQGGFFAESIALRERNLLPLPDSVTNEEAAIMEPVALVLHTLDMLKPDADDFATVIGQGPMGLLMMQVAKLKGCRVIAIDTQDSRLKLAEKTGILLLH